MPAATRSPAAKSSPEPAAQTPPPSFEQAMDRLESIVEEMENAQLPLEELIRRYEEGTRLIKACSEHLGAAEQRIETITRDAAGQPRTAEYSPATAPAAPDSTAVKTLNSKVDAPAPAVDCSADRDHEVSLF